MTTSSAKISAGAPVNVLRSGAATNTATITQLARGVSTFIRVKIKQNDISAGVAGTGTITLTVVDGASTTQLTSMALVAAGTYIYACPVKGGATYTVVTTFSAGNTTLLDYDVDIVELAVDPFTLTGGGGRTNLMGSADPIHNP